MAQTVADGLGLAQAPAPAQAARPTREDLPPSEALSIVKNGPPSFEGRKLGVLLTDGADASLFDALVRGAKSALCMVDVIAPKISGVVLSDGTLLPARQKIDGGPSVLYDAVVVLASPEGGALLAKDAAAKDFVNDAFAHCKFIGYSADAQPLFDKAGLTADLDEGCIALAKPSDAKAFLDACAALRFWAREAAVDLDAVA